MKTEEFIFLKGSRKHAKKVNQKVGKLIGNLTKDKPYTINYTKLKSRFSEEIEKYKNHPELIDISEFSMNYSFGYHFFHNINDMSSKEAMFIEVKNYLRGLMPKTNTLS